MKNPLASLKNKFGEVKGRTLLLVVVVVMVFVVAAVFSVRKNNAPILGTANTAQSRTATVKAPNIEATPGVGKVNDQAYIELQQQANLQKAERAIQKGTSAVATVTNDQFVAELSVPAPGIASLPGTGNNSKSAVAVAAAKQNAALEQYQKVYEEQMLREQEREQQKARQQAVQQEQAQVEAFEALMQTQIKGLMGQWKVPTQSYVRGKMQESTTSASQSTGSPGLPPLYKAGDIVFGIVETSVNSDEPGPVMAQVVSGPLTGAKLLGAFRRVDDQVFIEFSLLNAPNLPSSVPIKAVAIDPETARTALATDVDHHRLLRYSTLFGAAFLQGMGDAVLSSIQPDITVDNDDVLTVSSVSVGTRDQLIVGLGEVGRRAGEKMDKIFDMPPTVTVDSGTAIGLMFLQDFSLQPGSSAIQVVNTSAPGYVSSNGYPVGQPNASSIGTSVTSMANLTSQSNGTVSAQ